MAAVFSGHLVRAGPQQPVHVPDAAHPAAHGERDEHLSAVRPTTSIMVSRSPLDAVMSRNTSSSAPFRVVGSRQFHRIAGVAQVTEVDALHHPPGVHIEAGNHPHRHRHGVPTP